MQLEIKCPNLCVLFLQVLAVTLTQSISGSNVYQKLAAVFGEKCPFYGKVDGICNNEGSACCMIPVNQTNI
ncbi:Beta-defensin 50 [Lemmus lemmus]